MISYIILILVIIYIIRYSTTLDTIKPNVTNLHKNSLISIGIVPIFSKKNSFWHNFEKDVGLDWGGYSEYKITIPQKYFTYSLNPRKKNKSRQNKFFINFFNHLVNLNLI